MADFRTVLAAVLGVGLGALLVAYPDAVVRVQTMGRMPRDRGGAYGSHTPTPDRWRWTIRLLGIAVLGAGVYFGVRALSAM